MVDPIYQYGPYVVEIGESHTDPELKHSIYLIRNLDTNVVEAETSSLPRAVMTARASHLALIRLSDEQDPSDAELMEYEGMLDDMESTDGPIKH